MGHRKGVWAEVNLCCMSGRSRCETIYQIHHVIYQQKFRQVGRMRDSNDPRNLVHICYRHHRRHHAGLEPIPRAVLPAGLEEFATELGLGWWLDKHYPKEAA